MSIPVTSDHLLARLHHVLRKLGIDEASLTPRTQLADVLDSMALVEFLGLLADDCGVKPWTIEECVDRRFGTIDELAQAMRYAGMTCAAASEPETTSVQYSVLSTQYSVLKPSPQPKTGSAWLAASAVRLPNASQSATELDALLHRPAGWFERHAGIRSRCLWQAQDPLAAAVEAGQDCLHQAGMRAAEVGALLVTSEAPPLLVGLGAALHGRLHLPSSSVALEIGGACTGFLAALWTARHLLPTVGAVLVLAVEAPSQLLRVQPGTTGAAAALFGDGAAACLLTAHSTGTSARALHDVVLGTDGPAGGLLRVERQEERVELHMRGTALAERALAAMADTVRRLLERHGLRLDALRGLVAHGGNGRMPGLLARLLALPEERVWSTTPETGNLGSASLPAAWALHNPSAGPVIWIGVGAGLTWGAALLG